jgi:nudix-type nucleoside diphosphatase (YffH/AdpP family)
LRPLILEREVAQGVYLTVERWRIRLADGAVVHREFERHGDAAVVLPYDRGRRCALIVRLFRAPVLAALGQTTSEEACAGMIAQESPAAAARREAFEELGVALSSLEFVGRVWSSPGVSTERQSLFLAPYALSDRTAAGGGKPGEHEGVTVIERALADLAADADAAEIADAKLLTLVQTLRLRSPELFMRSLARPDTNAAASP